MIYIGLDQSSKIVGYAIMDEKELLDYGVYKVPQTTDLMKRAACILHFLDELIEPYKEGKMLIGFEDTQESRMNTNTFQLLTKILSILEYWAWSNNYAYRVCHVSSWRSNAGVKGKRREEKKANAIKIVKKRFGIDGIEEDAAEAVLITEYTRQKG